MPYPVVGGCSLFQKVLGGPQGRHRPQVLAQRFLRLYVFSWFLKKVQGSSFILASSICVFITGFGMSSEGLMYRYPKLFFFSD